MSYEIIVVEELAKNVKRFKISAPLVARHARPGQFLVLIVDEKGERIPLTIAGSDAEEGTVSVIFQEAGFSTRSLGVMKRGCELKAVLGPLGHATDIKQYGRVICVAGGVGIAEIFPIVRALRKAGNHVTGIIGARAAEFLILRDELAGVCDELKETTLDGSLGFQGVVTEVLAKEIASSLPHLVYAVGPVAMMKKVAEVTKPFGIKTIVSLNPVMVDATGMCGVCRCKVDGKTVFGCVDGPEFDAHKVDFDELSGRLNFLKEEEAQAGLISLK